MFCVDAQKGTSGAPRTHFRACKISKFYGGAPPDPLAPSVLRGRTLCICYAPPQSSWRPWHWSPERPGMLPPCGASNPKRASWSRSQATSRMHLPGSILCVLCPVSLLISHFCYVSCLFVFCFFVQKGNTSIGYSFCVPCIMQIIQTSRLIYHGSLGMRL